MSSKTPKVRQINYIAIIPHLLIMAGMVWLWYQMYPENAFLFGAITYILTSFILRNLISKDHRNGIKNNNSENYKEAISDFEKSYTFFSKHEWVDKYRIVTLLSSSKMSYREMALANIGYCYSQIGEGNKAKEYYERTLKEFPESGLAKSALNMMNSVEQTPSSKN